MILGVAAVFWKELFAGQVLFFRDAFNQSYPLAKFIHDVCRQGRLPYWNPLLNFGQPLMANPNSLFFYPDTLLIVLLPVAYAYNLHYILSFIIAAAGTYWLSRRCRQSRWAALFAAAAFAFSGPLLSLGSFYNEAACAAWIPWAMVAADKAAKERSVRPWLLLSVVFALQFLAGELFTLMGTFVLALAYVIYLKTRLGGTGRVAWFRCLRILGAFIASGFAALALAAVQFVPAAYLLAGSRRGVQGLRYSDTVYWSLHPLQLIETVLPHFFGNALDGYSTWSWVLNGRNLPYFPSIFLGFVPLLFAFVGWRCRSSASRPEACQQDPGAAAPFREHDVRRFVAWAAGAFLVLVLGSFTPVFALVYLLFPPLSLVRFPLKLLIIFTLLVALLAGWGIDAFRNGSSRWQSARRGLTVPLAALLALSIAVLALAFASPGLMRWPAEKLLVWTNGLFIYGHADLKLPVAEVHSGFHFLLLMIKIHFPGIVGFLIGALVWITIMAENPARGRKALPVVAALGILQLALVNYSANPIVPKRFYSYQPPVLRQLPSANPPYRIAYIDRRRGPSAASESAQSFFDFSSIPFVARLPMLAQTAFRDRIVLSRGTMLTGATVVHNADVDLSIPTDLFDFWIYERDQMPDRAREDCLLGRTNVLYEITPSIERDATLRDAGRIFNGSADPDYLYENRCASPRAYAASTAIRSAAPLEALTLLSDPRFDAADRVIIDSPGEPLPHNGDAHAAPAGKVRILRSDASEVVLEARMAHRGYVVLLDHYDRGWRARVDGRAVPVLRANLMFQAVPASTGRHLIEFEYFPQGLGTGLIISCVALVLIGAGILGALPWVWPFAQKSGLLSVWKKFEVTGIITTRSDPPGAE